MFILGNYNSCLINTFAMSRNDEFITTLIILDSCSFLDQIMNRICLFGYFVFHDFIILFLIFYLVNSVSISHHING